MAAGGDLEGEAAAVLLEMGGESWVCCGGWSVGHSGVVWGEPEEFLNKERKTSGGQEEGRVAPGAGDMYGGAQGEAGNAGWEEGAGSRGPRCGVERAFREGAAGGAGAEDTGWAAGKAAALRWNCRGRIEDTGRRGEMDGVGF